MQPSRTATRSVLPACASASIRLRSPGSKRRFGMACSTRWRRARARLGIPSLARALRQRVEQAIPNRRFDPGDRNRIDAEAHAGNTDLVAVLLGCIGNHISIELRPLATQRELQM